MALHPAVYGEDADGDGPAVLVVDDNLILVKLVIQTLTPHHLTCHWARSMTEARQIMGVFPIDLVITDIRPPVMDGIELARWIRQQPSLKSVPILFFTSDSDRSTIERAARISDVDYLLKPLRPKLFCERVMNLLEGRQLSN